MDRNDLVEKIQRYQRKYPDEASACQKMIAFIENNENCFERSLLKGHITGSCVLLSPDQSKVLLTHHKKLNKWIQLGGHSDGNPNTLEVAVREAQEESGIESIEVLSEEIHSLDIHEIPARKEEPTHLHFDLTFLLKANSEDYKVSEESHDLKWIPLKEAAEMDLEESVRRMISKL